MPAPSISFDSAQVPPMWRHLTLEGVQELLRNDVAELNRYLQLQAEDVAAARAAERLPDFRFRTLVEAWERTQDVHWSWYKEIQGANTAATQGPEGLGANAVGSGN